MIGATTNTNLKPPVRREASDIVRGAIATLLSLIQNSISLAEEEESLKEKLALLDEVGKASIRLVTLLKAERDLTVSQSKTQALMEASARLLAEERKQSSLEKGDQMEIPFDEPPA